MFEENQPLPQTIIKGYFLRTAHQKHDGTLVNFKRFCLNELAELTWAGLLAFTSGRRAQNASSELNGQKRNIIVNL